MTDIIVTHRKRIAYIKDVQAGGSVQMLKLAAENYRSKTVLFITDTSEVQTDQVEYRAINDFGIPKDMIYKKKAEIIKAKGIIKSGLIIINKTKSSIESAWSAIPKDPEDVIIVWDEADYDAPGHTSDKGSDIIKHELLDKLSKHSNEIHYMTATTAGLVISDIDFTEVRRIKTSESYLRYEECELVRLGEEDVPDMLIKGDLSPTLKNRFLNSAHEGVIIRTSRKMEDHSNIQDSLKALDPNISVSVLNGNTKDTIEPRTVTGVVIAHQMAARGVSFPNVCHAIVNFSKTTPQPTIVQALRNLGYGKRKEKNYIIGSNESIYLVEEAFSLEKTLKNILEEFPGNHEKRKEAVRNLRLDENLCILPKAKGNGFMHKKSKADYKITNRIPYSKEMEIALINAKQLFVSVVETPENKKTGSLGWGNRSFDRQVRGFLNHPPNSKVWLERSDLQYVTDDISIKRLVSKDYLSSLKNTWGFILDEATGKPLEIACFELYEEPVVTNSFTDQK